MLYWGTMDAGTGGQQIEVGTYEKAVAFPSDKLKFLTR